MCGRELAELRGLNVCSDCWQSLEPWRGAACPRCALPLVSDQVVHSTDARCGACRREEFDFDEARSFGVYTGNLRALILLLKFGQRERLGQRLGGLLAEVWRSAGGLGRLDAPVVIVPVPLYPSRQRERGFNQAELLARTRPTAPQTGLSLEERRENVRGVFAVVAAEPVRGRAVVLVDDVMTTGATLSAAAAALKAAGATRVTALTLARATPRFPDGPGHVPVDELRPDST